MSTRTKHAGMPGQGLVHQSLSGQAPAYDAAVGILTGHASFSVGLHSQSFSDRSFGVAVPRVWNGSQSSLRQDISSCGKSQLTANVTAARNK